MRASLHAGGASIFPRMETQICNADISVMTVANKQTQCFGSKLRSVLAQSETAGERGVCSITAWPRSTQIGVMYTYIMCGSPVHSYIMKIKIHSSCEIEDFVEIHLCKLCVILRSRVLRVVCLH